MNEMATVEYLLREYAAHADRLAYAKRKNFSPESISFYDGEKNAVCIIIRQRFGMEVKETDTEYIAKNSVCSVRVRKSDAEEQFKAEMTRIREEERKATRSILDPWGNLSHTGVSAGFSIPEYQPGYTPPFKII